MTIVERGTKAEIWLALAVLGSAACSGDAVTVGEQGSGATALFANSLECVRGDPFEPEVDWEGYVENSTDEYASQRVRIREPQGDDPGFVLFGAGPQLPEATDPDVGWPCPDMGGANVLPGFPYTIEKAFITDFRMQFRINSYEAMDSWCALHEESTVNPGQPGGGCDVQEQLEVARGTAIGPADMLCSYCECDSEGCAARHSDDPVSAAEDGIYFTFDIGVEGEYADGSVKNLQPDVSAALGSGLSVQRARFHRSE